MFFRKARTPEVDVESTVPEEEADWENEDDAIPATPRPPGMGRIAFLGVTSAMVVVAFLAASLLEGQPTGEKAGFAFAIVCYLMLLFPTASRVRNMGRTSLWAFTVFVPIYGQFLLWLCLIAPPEYFKTRRLDFAGILAGVFYVGLVALSLWLVVMEAMEPGWTGRVLLDLLTF